MNLQESIRRILREDKDHTNLLKGIIDSSDIFDYKHFCGFDIITPEERSDQYNFLNKNKIPYLIKVYFVGGPNSEVWPRTQAIRNKELDLMEELHEYIKSFVPFNIEMMGAHVNSCDGYKKLMKRKYTTDDLQESIRKVLREKSDKVMNMQSKILSQFRKQDQMERNEYSKFVQSEFGGDYERGAKEYAKIKNRNSDDIFGDKKRMREFILINFDFNTFSSKDWENYWLLSQHSDNHPEFQKKALNIIKQNLGEDNEYYEYLHDRISCRESGTQIYGTQNICKKSKMNLQESIRRILREEDYSPAGKEVTPNKIVIHKSNPMFRDKIIENGLKVRAGECYKIYVGYGVKCKPAIFATNSTNKRAWFDSTYDDDIWEINTEMIPDVKWYKDRHYESRSKHIVTFQDIPKEAITLKYEGTGSGDVKKWDKDSPNLFESIKRILREEITEDKNLYGEKLKPCSTKPMTGFYRDGYCRTGDDDTGSHTVCAKVTEEFLEFTNSMGNNLDMLEPGDKWCLCAMRWKEAKDNGIYVKVDKSATNIKTLDII